MRVQRIFQVQPRKISPDQVQKRNQTHHDMSKKSARGRGQDAEELAAAYLESKGWTVLDRNYFFQRAEVDIVAFDQTCIIFVEVKSRSDTNFGHPEDYVDEEKKIGRASCRERV